MCQKQACRKLIKEAKENFLSSSGDLETASVKSVELHSSVHSASVEKNIFFDEMAQFFPPLSVHATREIIFYQTESSRITQHKDLRTHKTGTFKKGE
ncbi:hypothetical protein CDAR_295461 [Caerostris darwini]|uniref:Uncharacterized protein n=1 Tax=Caerostris darwini TaxID=1538125 RepID=A0AAV4NH26_9ARAC|nr:hypothetical protein CDAR_295461 [Caerostris darwini]